MCAPHAACFRERSLRSPACRRAPRRPSGSRPRPWRRRRPPPWNVVLILADDHRYDALGFLGHPFLKTPHLDALAREGVHFKNAFVTTALCSPSRASILTGLYAHRHQVVDNNNPVPPGTVFFPQHLQAAGYETAFVGKWHMGSDGDAPQPGFDHWVSFKGQGTYLPDPERPQRQRPAGRAEGLHHRRADGLRASSGSNARRAIGRSSCTCRTRPCTPTSCPPRGTRGRYQDAPFTPPKTMALPGGDADWPMWMRNQRNNWHGVDFPYHSRLDVAEYYRRYIETLLAVDDSVGRVVERLQHAACSIRRWSSTWATTATPAASTA